MKYVRGRKNNTSELAGPVVLVSCGKHKLDYSASAKDSYVSRRFKAAREFAENFGSSWFILSAKHGLVEPDQVIAPYDQDLNALTAQSKALWVETIVSGLLKRNLVSQYIVVLAAGPYAELLRERLKREGFLIIYPLNDMAEDIHADILERINTNPDRLSHYNRFYDLLWRLQKMPGQMVPFNDFEAKNLPKAGVYFFFDGQESTRFFHRETLRVIRIGTHGVSKGSKSLLWHRLRTHRGNDDGSGSHRSSIFRLHVGNAILASQKKDLVSWGVGDNASKEIRDSELQLELEVSQYIRGLRVAYLPVLDEAGADSDRSYIEKNSISLLTQGGPIDLPSVNWLGNYSSSQYVKSSGLWNVNYVGDNYDPQFLSVFEKLVAIYEKGKTVKESLAPLNWRLNMLRGSHGQNELF
ncbi:DUF6884 domain-containing protein [Limnobacter sp.]|uniref:DUF6884 domain-containing protein n=1 Tax=Limnobacter sp. TaxID=2003368 RepID=UPI0025C68966|nr:DUF6884 domain-containing protein [Limnobacter sp.]